MMKNVLSTTFFGLFLVWTGLSGAGDVPSHMARVNAAADALSAAGAAGFSMGIVNADGLAWSDSRGTAGAGRPMTADTVMNIASISKTLTGASLMKLVEQGRLDLDRDINDYLDFSVVHPRFPDAPITTRQLLTHTSGILDRGGFYSSELSYHPGGDNPMSLGEFAPAYFDPAGSLYDLANYAEWAPGTRWSYSNTAYGLAGYLVEVLSGQPLNEFSKAQFFTPLGMDATGWMLSEIDPEAHAQLFRWEDGEHVPQAWYGLATWPDGGVRTSLNDLARWMTAMINGGAIGETRVLAEDTFAAMFQPQFQPGMPLAGATFEDYRHQGVSWIYPEPEHGLQTVGHSGSDPGVRTLFLFLPDPGLGAIVLVNTSSDEDAFYEAADDLMTALLQAAVSKP